MKKYWLVIIGPSIYLLFFAILLIGHTLNVIEAVNNGLGLPKADTTSMILVIIFIVLFLFSGAILAAHNTEERGIVWRDKKLGVPRLLLKASFGIICLIAFLVVLSFFDLINFQSPFIYVVSVWLGFIFASLVIIATYITLRVYAIRKNSKKSQKF